MAVRFEGGMAEVVGREGGFWWCLGGVDCSESENERLEGRSSTMMTRTEHAWLGALSCCLGLV